MNKIISLISLVTVIFLSACDPYNTDALLGTGTTTTTTPTPTHTSYTELEGAAGAANDTIASAESLGVTLAPGDTVTVSGNMTTSGTDYFSFNTGTAVVIDVNVTWTTAMDIDNYIEDAAAILAGSSVGSATSENLTWLVDTASSTRYIALRNFSATVTGAYTMVITAY
ncbi:MAG: hypothetical protein OEZ36_03215 [Spirochaetota bacterium]|nr:hypothetical protein [Spirochaetota bacterium]